MVININNKLKLIIYYKDSIIILPLKLKVNKKSTILIKKQIIYFKRVIKNNIYKQGMTKRK